MWKPVLNTLREVNILYVSPAASGPSAASQTGLWGFPSVGFG
jgi:hypothetical protein